MLPDGQSHRLLLVVGTAAFAIALIAGIGWSVRVEGHLPAIDLPHSGASVQLRARLKRRDYDGAIQLLQMQSRLFPNDATVQDELGQLLGHRGRLKEARAHFQELVRLRPNSADGHASIGSTYLDSGQPALAIPCFEEALRLKPDFPMALNRLGIALAQLGRFSEAEQCFVKAAELSPDDPEALSHLERVRTALQRRALE